ncbi:MAG: DNA alkylation repair protein [bacterium]|nr:DNA alkylation repair protein [bacterium]
MEFVRDHWTKKEYEQFVNELIEMGEEEYAKFHSKLNPGADNILGIRSPKLRAIAKEILKGNARAFLEVVEDTYNEEDMLHCMIIGGLKEKQVPYDEIMEYIKTFIPYIKNWSVCDTFCSSLKITKNHKREMFEFLRQYAVSETEYEARFAFVMYLDHFIEEPYLEEIFRYCDQCNVKGYYVQMAIAWLISICYIKEKEKTEAYLEHNQLDRFTFNKALQKIVESYRVPEEEKEEIRKRKRK